MTANPSAPRQPLQLPLDHYHRSFDSAPFGRGTGYKPATLWKYRPDGRGSRDSWIHGVAAQVEVLGTAETMFWAQQLQKPEIRGKFTHARSGNVTSGALATKVRYPLVPAAAQFQRVPLPPLPRTSMTPNQRRKVEAANRQLADALAQQLRANGHL